MKEICVLIGVNPKTKVMYEVGMETVVDIKGAEKYLENFEIVDMEKFNDLLGIEKLINVFYIMNYDTSFNVKKVKKHIFVKMYEMYRQDDKRSSLIKNEMVDGMSKDDIKLLDRRMCRLAFKMKANVAQ